MWVNVKSFLMSIDVLEWCVLCSMIAEIVWPHLLQIDNLIFEKSEVVVEWSWQRKQLISRLCVLRQVRDFIEIGDIIYETNERFYWDRRQNPRDKWEILKTYEITETFYRDMRHNLWDMGEIFWYIYETSYRFIRDMRNNLDDVRWQFLLIMGCTSTGH